MVTKYEGCKRKFYHLSRAWYGGASLASLAGEIDDEINIGLYHDDGGTPGEFAIRWLSIGGESVACLVAYYDAWDVLSQFNDVLHSMKELNDTNPTPDAVRHLLLERGVEDATPTESPYPKPGLAPLHKKPSHRSHLVD